MVESLSFAELGLSLAAGSLTTLSPCVFPILPLVGVAYASRRGLSRLRGWVSARAHAVRQGFGGLILLAGLAILSGADKWLEARIVALLPDAWIALTTIF